MHRESVNRRSKSSSNFSWQLRGIDDIDDLKQVQYPNSALVPLPLNVGSVGVPDSTPPHSSKKACMRPGRAHRVGFSAIGRCVVSLFIAIAFLLSTVFIFVVAMSLSTAASIDNAPIFESMYVEFDLLRVPEDVDDTDQELIRRSIVEMLPDISNHSSVSMIDYTEAKSKLHVVVDCGSLEQTRLAVEYAVKSESFAYGISQLTGFATLKVAVSNSKNSSHPRLSQPTNLNFNDTLVEHCYKGPNVMGISYQQISALQSPGDAITSCMLNSECTTIARSNNSETLWNTGSDMKVTFSPETTVFFMKSQGVSCILQSRG